MVNKMAIFDVIPIYHQNIKKLTIYKLLKANGIKLFTSDRGALPNSWFFDPNGFNANSSSYHLDNWNHPITEEREERVQVYIKAHIETDNIIGKQGLMVGGDALHNLRAVPETSIKPVQEAMR